MDLLKRKQKELPPLWADGELEALATNYETVLDWLVGLSDDDYAKMVKITEAYRKANADESKIRGIEAKPRTFIDATEPELVPAQVNHPKPKSKKQ